MNYFAYGSNLWPARLSARIGLCRTMGVAVARGWTLTFNKEGGDGSAKCDAQFTGNNDDELFGAIYEVTPEQRKVLDVFEGLGHGYDIENIEVEPWVNDGSLGRPIEAQTYVAIADHHFRARQAGDNPVVPYTWYFKFVLQGAYHHKFPSRIIQAIEKQPHKADSCPIRVNKNAHILSLNQTQAANLAGTPHAT